MGLMIALSLGAPVLFASLLLLSPTKEVHAGKARWRGSFQNCRFAGIP